MDFVFLKSIVPIDGLAVFNLEKVTGILEVLPVLIMNLKRSIR